MRLGPFDHNPAELAARAHGLVGRRFAVRCCLVRSRAIWHILSGEVIDAEAGCGSARRLNTQRQMPALSGFRAGRMDFPSECELAQAPNGAYIQVGCIDKGVRDAATTTAANIK